MQIHDGHQKEQVADALVSAYPSRTELEVMVAHKLSENLNKISAETDNLQQSAFRLVKFYNKEDEIDYLIEAALRGNPRNPQLKAVATMLSIVPGSYSHPVNTATNTGTPAAIVVRSPATNSDTDMRGQKLSTADIHNVLREMPRQTEQFQVFSKLATALENRQAISSRPYYNAEADERDRLTYYQAMPAPNEPVQLFNWLHELLERTHHPRLEFDPRQHLFPWVDLRPNASLRSVYEKVQFNFLDLDPESAQYLLDRGYEFDVEGGSPSGGTSDASVVIDESRLNCDHIVPQSWYGKREPMRGDLHNQFTCERMCNSYRGPATFADLSDETAGSMRDRCGRRHGAKFEPRAGKGAVARATLYFLLRYPGTITRGTGHYTKMSLRTLVAWHNDSPVGVYEKHRNQAIFAKQGNRNPLIDFPELAKQLDFSLGLGK